jgi:hypothetical protein
LKILIYMNSLFCRNSCEGVFKSFLLEQKVLKMNNKPKAYKLDRKCQNTANTKDDSHYLILII